MLQDWIKVQGGHSNCLNPEQRKVASPATQSLLWAAWTVSSTIFNCFNCYDQDFQMFFSKGLHPGKGAIQHNLLGTFRQCHFPFRKGSLRDTYLVIKMDPLMFCWRTEVQDRSAYTHPHQQAQLISDVQPQLKLVQPPSWAWCSGACLSTFTNGHVKVLLCTHIFQPIISEASCAQTRVKIQDLCFLCWQWQRHFIISLTIGKKHRRWWACNDSSMGKAWQLIL